MGQSRMKIDIDLIAGPYSNRKSPTKRDVDSNIRAIQRAIDGKPLANDCVALIHTKSILEGIQKQLSEDKVG